MYQRPVQAHQCVIYATSQVSLKYVDLVEKGAIIFEL